MLTTNTAHNIIKQRHESLLVRLNARQTEFSPAAKAVLEIILTPYLEQAWFIFMNESIYLQRVNTLQAFIDAIDFSFTTGSDLKIIEVLQTPDTAHVQPKRLKALMDEVLLKIAKGQISVYLILPTGERFVVNSMKDMAVALQKINEHPAMQALQKYNVSLQAKVESMQKSIDLQEEDITDLKAGMKELMELVNEQKSQIQNLLAAKPQSETDIKPVVTALFLNSV